MKVSTKFKNFILILLLLYISDLAIFLNIFILRQILVFFLITFLPGFLILRILQLNHIASIEKLLLGVGISISFLMFVGLFMNFLFPQIGIQNPISLHSLIVMINISIIILSIIGYKKDVLLLQSFYPFKFQKLIFPIFFLLNIPIIASLGALVTLYCENSILSLFFIVVVVLTVILITFNKFIPERLYSFSIFMIALGLLLNRTLTSPYLFGSDIHYEYYFAQLVKNTSYWDYSLTGAANAFLVVNSMLSVTILPNIYSILLDMNLIYIYKIIYSCIFSFVPVGLYSIYRFQMKPVDAFLSAFFSISFYAFFLVMPWVPRQQVGELYIVLLIMLLFVKIDLAKKSALFILFMASLIVSHYGLSYIFLFYIICVCLGSFVLKITDAFISPSKVILFSTVIIFWYIYTSNSAVFDSLINLLSNIYSFTVNEMFFGAATDPDVAKGLGIGITNIGFSHTIAYLWGIFTELMLFIGLINVVINSKSTKFNSEYLLFCLLNLGLIFICIVLPYLAASLLMYRIYQITLLFLSPFCIIGIKVVLKSIVSVLKFNVSPQKLNCVRYILLIILIPYFLFNTGFIYEITERPSSHSFIVSLADKSENSSYYYSHWSYFTDGPIPTQDIVSCQWSAGRVDPSSTIYVDEVRRCEIAGYGLILKTRELSPNVPKNEIIYLGYLNIINKDFWSLDPEKLHSSVKYNLTDFYFSLDSKNKIYTNGGSLFYT